MQDPAHPQSAYDKKLNVFAFVQPAVFMIVYNDQIIKSKNIMIRV